MQNLIVLIIVASLGGVAVGLQGPLTSLMSQRIGTWESIFIIHIGGAILAAIPLLFIGGGGLGGWRNVPWYALCAGALGLVVLSAVSYTIPRGGVTVTVTLIIVAQLITGALLDHFGLLDAAIRPLDLSRAIGIVVLFVGTWLIVR